jgi:NAD(P)-dependent dehydrogenase (short-subunit alcohol dehydrogenase family)
MADSGSASPLVAVPHPVLVIGGGGGIGRAVCLTLARQGDPLVVADFDFDQADCTVQMCTSIGGAAVAHRLDVTDADEVAGLISSTIDRFGYLAGVVNAAGVEGVVQPVGDYPADVFDKVMRTNVTGAFHVLRHAVPAMIRQGEGSVVTIGSTSSIRGRANICAYVASKHAVLGLVRSVAMETVSSRVRVNAVLPGPIETRMTRSLNQMSAAITPGDGDPLGRHGGPLGRPQDVADVVAYLLSPRAAHVNGAAWVVDGGRTLG